MLLNNRWITEEIKEEVKKKYLETNENEKKKKKTQWSKTYGMQQKQFQEERL